MKTIYKIKQLLKPSDEVLRKVIDLPTGDLINETIIAKVMTSITSDIEALQFCDIMENLIDDASSKAHIEILRNGNFTAEIS